MPKLRRSQAVWLVAAVPLMLQWSLPANASITCMVRRHGSYVCTYFCQNGFICDNDNLRCLPGPEVKAKLSDLKEKARIATLVANQGQAKTAQQANSQSTGYDLGSTYYIWNGDPREIPTPQYRRGGGFSPLPSGGYGTVRQSLRSRMPTVRTPTVSGPSVSIPSIAVPMPDPTVSTPSVPGPTVSAPSPTVQAPSVDAAATPNGMPWYWYGTDYSDYCANANGLERTTALYGYLCIPDKPTLSDRLRQQMNAGPDRPPPDKLPNDGCGPGTGLMPDRAAFGAWTCQPLNGPILGLDTNVASAKGNDMTAPPQDQADASDPTAQELNDYLNMFNPNSGGNMRGDLGGPAMHWGSDDYLAIERLQQ